LKSDNYVIRTLFVCLCLLLALCSFDVSAQTTVRALADDIKITLVAEHLPATVHRLDYHADRDILFVMHRNGDIATFDYRSNVYEKVADGSVLGISEPSGFAISPQGQLFVGGNTRNEEWVTGQVKRSRLTAGSNVPEGWMTVAETVPYPLSKDFNHLMSELAVDRTGDWIYINSGSRTDHGEVQNNSGAHPGVREVPITSAIIRVPSNGDSIILENDAEALSSGGFLFADGVRNHFDIVAGPNGHLFGVENSGDRDDAEELNWLQEGHHYGFPWRIGTHDNPQQFPGYDPSKDPLINPKSSAAQLGLFKDDPGFHAPPEGVVFTDPLPNYGPDGVEYRDPNTGQYLDGENTGEAVGSFTPHKSPLGLVFDTTGVLAAPYRGDGFVLGWNQSGTDLLGPFNDPGEDLLHLDMTYDPAKMQAYEMSSSRIADSFSMPIDAILVDTTMFVMEMRFGCAPSPAPCARMWRIDFPKHRDVIEPPLDEPTALVPDVTVRRLSGLPGDVVRIDYSPSDDTIYYMTRSGNVWAFNRVTGQPRLVANASGHGISEARGLAITKDGRVFLLGFVNEGESTVAILKRGSIGRTTIGNWETVMQTVPYPLAGNNFDHFMNAVSVDPQGQHVYVSSGSRTDHGEIQTNSGVFPDVREVPLTSAIFVLPADTTGAVLENDEQFLVDNGILFADGFRNTFDLAWGPNGHLFGSENSGDRDDSEEINWIREDGHYGFPWRMGTNDTGQQFPDYDPSKDLLIGPGSSATFVNDPSYPPRPTGVEFAEPIESMGPDADNFRDPTTGALVDASDSGLTIGTLTAHRSPLGLVFDTAGVLAGPYEGGGFVLSWTGEGSALLDPMGDLGEDLLHLELDYAEDSGYRLSSKRIVAGFSLPIDAVMVGSSIFVIEMSFGGENGLWEVELPRKIGVSSEKPSVMPSAASINVYPNPFSGSVTVSMTLDSPELVTTEVVDMTGRRVRSVDTRLVSPGAHTQHVPMDGLAPGTYLLRVKLGKLISSRVITLIR
jgi:glucose/arabinose dehydrogenase